MSDITAELKAKYLAISKNGSTINFDPFGGAQNLFPMFRKILGENMGVEHNTYWEYPEGICSMENSDENWLPQEYFSNKEWPKMVLDGRCIANGSQSLVLNMGDMYLEQKVAWWHSDINGGPNVYLRFDSLSDATIELAKFICKDPSPNNNSLSFAIWENKSLVSAEEGKQPEKLNSEIRAEFFSGSFSPSDTGHFYKVMQNVEGPDEKDFMSAILSIADKNAVRRVAISQYGMLNGNDFSITREYEYKDGRLEDQKGLELKPGYLPMHTLFTQKLL